MKLDDLRKKARAWPRALPEQFELPPTMDAAMREMLIRVEALSLGLRAPLKGSRELRLLQALEKLSFVVQSANGYYMIRTEGREWLAWYRRHQASVEANIVPIVERATASGRKRRVLEALAAGTFDINSFHAVRPQIENALADLLGAGLIDFVDGKYVINSKGREELE